MYSHAQTVLELTGTSIPSVQPPESWPTSMHLPSWRNPLCYVLCDARSGLRPRAWWALGKLPQSSVPSDAPLVLNGKLFQIQLMGVPSRTLHPRHGQFSQQAPPAFLPPSALRCFSMSDCGLFQKELQTSCSLLYNYTIQFKKQNKIRQNPSIFQTGQ